MAFFFSSRRRHTRCLSDWSSDVCSSDLAWSASFTWLASAPAADRPAMGALANQVKDALQAALAAREGALGAARSEERRVGKECRARWRPEPQRNKTDTNTISHQSDQIAA